MHFQNSRGNIWNFIFTLSINKTWRKIKSITDGFFPCFAKKSCSNKRVIYMLNFMKNLMVAFDLRCENFRIIWLGNDICEKRFNYDLIEVKGKLALLDCCGCFACRNDLWILENLEKQEWKSHVIHVPPQWKVVEDMLKPLYCSAQVLYDSPDNEIILLWWKFLFSLLLLWYWEKQLETFGNSWNSLRG